MSETLKINLTKILAILLITATLSSWVVGGYITYDSARTAKDATVILAQVDSEISHRLASLENKQAKFEGMIGERTLNTSNDVKELKSDMKLLLNKLQLGKSNGEEDI